MSALKEQLKTEFGLIIPKKGAKDREQSRKSFRSAQASAAFGDESDDDDDDDFSAELSSRADVNAALLREAARKQRSKQLIRQQEEAKEQDATVFQYDEVYDEMQAERQKSDPRFERMSSGEKKKPKYIQKLLQSARERKRREDLRDERKAHREREQEDGEFAGKEEFITNAYRKKLEEIRETERLEKAEAEEEARNDVTKKGNLNGFYRNLLTTNVAMGGKERTIGLSAAVKSEIEGVQRSDKRASVHGSVTGSDDMDDRGAANQSNHAELARKKAKRDAAMRERQLANVQFRDLPNAQPTLTDEEIKDKYARKTDESAVEAARRRALERRRKRKGPVRMEDD